MINPVCKPASNRNGPTAGRDVTAAPSAVEVGEPYNPFRAPIFPLRIADLCGPNSYPWLFHGEKT